MRIPRRQILQLAVLVGADALLFGFTDATKVPSFMVIVAFGLLGITFYCLFYGLLSLVRLYGLPIRSRKYLSIYMTIVLCMLLALKSIGELGLRDALVLLALATVAYLYSSFSRSSKRSAS